MLKGVIIMEDIYGQLCKGKSGVYTSEVMLELKFKGERRIY